MTQEIQTCQSCKEVFKLSPDDVAFCESIGVPRPTWCPMCRMRRRMVFRNLRFVYKRKCVGSEKEVFSSFAPESPFVVYEQGYWWSDAWDPLVYGREYDFSRSFFEQFRELQLEIPWLSGYNRKSEGSEYCNNVYKIRDCYLVFNTGFSTECAYGADIVESHKCLDTLKALKCEIGYDLFDCEHCSYVFFSSHLRNCTNVFFSSHLVDCHDCFLCFNLKHKKFCLQNEQLTKEEYEQRVVSFDLGSYKVLQELKRTMSERRSLYPVRFMQGIGNVNVTGDYLDGSHNTRDTFFSRACEDVRYSQFLLFTRPRDSCDITTAGGERCYEVEEGGGYNVKFCWLLAGTGDEMNSSHDAEYSMNCFDCANIFGCIGLRNKEYHIFNRPYSKSEYHDLRERIVAQMRVVPYLDCEGREFRYGEFFPPEFSPFAYNESLAGDYAALTKQEALGYGYRWRDSDARDYQVTKRSEELSDHIKDVPSSITGEIIECGVRSFSSASGISDQCSTAFRVTSQELAFYRERLLPLPRFCFNCRHRERLGLCNPFALWKRRCMNPTCANEFETSYAPDRLEIVYCEQCYQHLS